MKPDKKHNAARSNYKYDGRCCYWSKLHRHEKTYISRHVLDSPIKTDCLDCGGSMDFASRYETKSYLCGSAIMLRCCVCNNVLTYSNTFDPVDTYEERQIRLGLRGSKLFYR